MNPMHGLRIDKVVVHMAVGEAGEKLVKAEDVMKKITGHTPVRSVAKRTLPAFSIRKGAPIGCKVTLRGEDAEQFIQTALTIAQRKLNAASFDTTGNFSFGIEEHTDFPGMSYDPSIGIFGMDVNVVLQRRGARVARRRIAQIPLPAKQKVKRDEAIVFMREQYKVEVQ
ncbi:MAG: 50S ribosomal protein L5 [Methanomicrobiales archaeon]|nr:50S ribosomal protein L5 [Methanomicrobiales archaeon]